MFVEVDPIYPKDGNVWTSAGITAGIDMSLAIVDEDLGKVAVIAMARSLVATMIQSGGHSQFSADPDRQAREGEGRFTDVHDWIAGRLQSRVSVEDMARECGMSPRSFPRRYSEVVAAPRQISRSDPGGYRARSPGGDRQKPEGYRRNVRLSGCRADAACVSAHRQHRAR